MRYVVVVLFLVVSLAVCPVVQAAGPASALDIARPGWQVAVDTVLSWLSGASKVLYAANTLAELGALLPSESEPNLAIVPSAGAPTGDSGPGFGLGALVGLAVAPAFDGDPPTGDIGPGLEPNG